MSVPPAVAVIVEEVATKHGLEALQLYGSMRRKDICLARFECWFRLRTELNFASGPPSLPHIGRWFGRHHTTILNGLIRLAQLDCSTAQPSLNSRTKRAAKMSHTPPRVRLILAATAREHGVTVDDLLGHSICRSLTHARRVAATRILAQINIKGAPASLPQIGLWMNRDHTSILYGLRRYATNGDWSQKRRGMLPYGRKAGALPCRIMIANGERLEA